MKKTLFFLISLMILAFLLYQNNKNEENAKLFQHMACSDSCLMNIRVNETDINTAEQLLHSNPKITITHVENVPYSSKKFIAWRWENLLYSGEFIFRYDEKRKTHVLEHMSISVPKSITFGDLAAIYGDPSHISAGISRMIRHSPTPEELFFITVFWEDIGISAHMASRNLYMDDIYHISAGLVLITQNGLDSYLEANEMKMLPFTQKWEGNKSFKFYCFDEDKKSKCY